MLKFDFPDKRFDNSVNLVFATDRGLRPKVLLLLDMGWVLSNFVDDPDDEEQWETLDNDEHDYNGEDGYINGSFDNEMNQNIVCIFCFGLNFAFEIWWLWFSFVSM